MFCKLAREGWTAATLHGVAGHARGLKASDGGSNADAQRDLARKRAEKLRIEIDREKGDLVDAESILTHTRTFVGAIVSGLSNWSARMTKDRHLCVATDRDASASMARMKETALKVSDEIFARGDAEDAKAESHLARAEAPKREMANQVVRSATHERTGDHAARLESKAQEIRLM